MKSGSSWRRSFNSFESMVLHIASLTPLPGRLARVFLSGEHPALASTTDFRWGHGRLTAATLRVHTDNIAAAERDFAP
jgi:hypothetical protein